MNLPEAQMNAVLRAIVPDHEGQLRVESFLERFQVRWQGRRGGVSSSGAVESLAPPCTEGCG